jgi:hypothetical protein
MEYRFANLESMLKPQDIVVLMKLVDENPGWTFDKVAGEIGLSASAVHRSLARAQKAGLYDANRRRVNAFAFFEFLAHGARYVFPAEQSGEARGVPTAWAAPPLADRLSASKRNVPVWPHAKGKARGIALEPLHPVVPGAALRDPEFGELLALFDAIRIGNARERKLATRELGLRLGVEDFPA